MSPTEKKFNESITHSIQSIKNNTERMQRMRVNLEDRRASLFSSNVEKFSRITQHTFLEAKTCLDKL
jgi:hypothetical protein